MGDQAVSEYLNEIQHEKHQEYIIEWLRAQRINRVGLTYRLDPEAAVDMVGYFIRALRSAELLSHQGGPIDGVFFAGLPSACERIEKEHKGLVVTFGGGESPSETLVKLNVPSERIPRDVLAGSGYDDFRLQFGSDVINSQEYLGLQPVDRSGYPEFGTRRDTVERRLQHALKHEPFYP